MHQNDKMSQFYKLYSNVDGYAISSVGKSKLTYFYGGYLYGEVTYEGFSGVLKHIDITSKKIFYDLGSGTGKAIILASLLGNFSQLIGIEIIKDLHEESEKILKNYKSKSRERIKYILGNFHDIDFSSADVIHINMNATCFEYEFSDAMIAKFEALKKGAQILTNTLALEIPSYKIKHLGDFPFTWGNASVFLHKKIR